ncbi:interleukin-12 subunit beta-like [Sinocyclocheilus rhinocerous]|uniref:Interleukin-12 subunit beta n=1 Tax=Sinocyclocheilus rhinocerous TaxID=307959 RepID=A0A673IQN0_9TELE|nr:PREDICTED: interleukin-12 subunit beta-like [Sinocyclocheilus rhinocerous]
MNKIVLVILQAVLQLAGSTSLRFIKPNVVALEVSDLSSFEVSLHCGEQYKGEQICWERDGESISETRNHITVTIDGLRGGNFTCHRPNRDLLNYTLLLVHPVEFPKGGVLIQSSDTEFISCTARNYDGQFHCSWKWHQKRIQRAVVYFTAIRNSSYQCLINCTLDSDISGLTCIDKDYCPYSEESRSINLTLFVRNLYRLEEHHRTFLIRDIVKPDKVSITKIQDDVFEWHPPETWSFPCSFFPLSYEVKVVPNNHSCDYKGSRVEKNETNETHYNVKLKKTYTFCVRAQDPLTKNVWGDWSHYHQRKHRHTSEK